RAVGAGFRFGLRHLGGRGLAPGDGLPTKRATAVARFALSIRFDTHSCLSLRTQKDPEGFANDARLTCVNAPADKGSDPALRCPAERSAGFDSATHRTVRHTGTHAMNPARKRRIRLVVALTAATLLASALIYTSFSASSEAVTASKLAASATNG